MSERGEKGGDRAISLKDFAKTAVEQANDSINEIDRRATALMGEAVSEEDFLRESREIDLKMIGGLETLVSILIRLERRAGNFEQAKKDEELMSFLEGQRKKLGAQS